MYLAPKGKLFKGEWKFLEVNNEQRTINFLVFCSTYNSWKGEKEVLDVLEKESNHDKLSYRYYTALVSVVWESF